MKLCVAALVLGSASAFTPAFTARASTKLSVATEAVARPSKFDSKKKKYKGFLPDRTSAPDIEFSYDDFEEAVQNVSYNFNRNDVVSGTVVQFENGGAVIDIGAKSSAYLPLAEAGLLAETRNIEDLFSLDTDLDVQIVSEEDENGQLIVSVKRLQWKAAWEKVQAMSEADEVFEGEVIAVNRGGAILNVENLRAFLPGSHLTGAVPTEDIIGTTLPLKFLEVNVDNNKLVVSNRRAVVEAQMNELSRGDVVQGVVKALKPYGAFVEVGGMSGLLHISQISYDRIDDLEKVFQPGSVLKCMIIDHDKANGRIALSTKTLEPEPGDMLKDPQMVYEMAEETAQKYHERMEAERKAREEAAKDIVLGLGDSSLSLDDDEEVDGADEVKDE